ncbi:hypothetical protein HJG60_011582 [Phyllostomus discolor]|uniref:Uncharacterized protein n=1 Tax=Phyllostomus discolor TaxID=89673 RepID=A0A833ZTX9_9CHIR|nr:hypothetical protein HJG60_011582 [Phyllostomus discolor]
MNSPVRLRVSPSTSTPTGVFNQWFEALFPRRWDPGLHGLSHSPVSPGLSARERGTTWFTSHLARHSPPQSATLMGSPAAALPRTPLPQQPVSAPPAGLGECVFFNSLVVGLLYCPIFCHFRGFFLFVFKLLLSFFWLCKEVQCVYLHLHLGQKSNDFLKSSPKDDS